MRGVLGFLGRALGLIVFLAILAAIGLGIGYALTFYGLTKLVGLLVNR